MRGDASGEAAADDRHSRLVGVPGVHRLPIDKIGKMALKRLARRSRESISKHVAEHLMHKAGKLPHGVFLGPRIKPLVRAAIEKAVQVGKRRGPLGAQVIEEGGIRITRQGSRQLGRSRILIEQRLAKPIGDAGESVLRVVLDHTGKIITAFPADRFLGLGVGAVALDMITSSTAEAAEGVAASIDRQVALENASARAGDDDSWWEWVPLIGDIWGGSLNAGENESLAAYREGKARDKYIDKTVLDVVRAVEDDLQRSLGPTEIDEIREQTLMILVSGIELADVQNGDTP